MPQYQYVCEKCGKKFEKVMTISEREKNPKPPCPECKSKKVTQLLEPFFALTSKKS